MGLTGIAPVVGAISMVNYGHISIFGLFILFIIGCLSHIFGFVINDILDIKIDKISKELATRPLVSGKITTKKAFYLAFLSLIISFILSVFFYENISSYIIILSILIFANIFAIIYNILSKKYPGMDFFVAGAVFFLILFGASTIGTPTTLAWIVAFIGGLQVLFMNLINGTIKDIDHDEKGIANTLAIKLGVRGKTGRIIIPLSFKIIGYLIESCRVFLIFIPFIFLNHPYDAWQIFVIFVLIIITFFSIHNLLSMDYFNRKQIRKNIGIIVILMYMTTPVMLSSLNLYIIILAFIPPIWFIFSNIILHKTILEAKTM